MKSMLHVGLISDRNRRHTERRSCIPLIVPSPFKLTPPALLAGFLFAALVSAHFRENRSAAHHRTKFRERGEERAYQPKNKSCSKH
jgi:hypothetical protein